jgi:hypothetical protein
MRTINEYAILIKQSYMGIDVNVISEDKIMVTKNRTRLVLDMKDRTYKTETEPHKSGRIGSILQLLKEVFN